MRFRIKSTDMLEIFFVIEQVLRFNVELWVRHRTTLQRSLLWRRHKFKAKLQHSDKTLIRPKQRFLTAVLESHLSNKLFRYAYFATTNGFAL